MYAKRAPCTYWLLYLNPSCIIEAASHLSYAKSIHTSSRNQALAMRKERKMSDIASSVINRQNLSPTPIGADRTLPNMPTHFTTIMHHGQILLPHRAATRTAPCSTFKFKPSPRGTQRSSHKN